MRLAKAIAVPLGALWAVAACSEQSASKRRDPVERHSVVDTSPPRGPWLLLNRAAELAPTLNSGDTELLATPSDRKPGEPLVSLSTGAFDDEFWLTLFQEWSPDGRTLVFDAQHSLHEEEYEARLFWTDFSSEVPSKPQLIENLPKGVELWLGHWDATSSAFTVEHENELYVVQRDATGRLNATLMALDAEAAGSLCAGGKFMLWSTDSGLSIVSVDQSAGVQRQLPDATSFEVSADGKWIALVAQGAGDAGGAEVAVTACDGTGDVRTIGNAPSTDTVWFSPNSRYLLVGDGWDRVTYFDLLNPEREPWESQSDATAVYDWSDDSSYVVVESAGNVILLDLDSSRQLKLDLGDEYMFTSHYLLTWTEVADAGPRQFRILDPHDPQTPLARFEMDGAASLLGVDRKLTRVAFQLETDEGTFVSFITLDDPTQVTQLKVPERASVDARSFLVDGNGVFAWADDLEPALYWIPAEGKPEPKVERLFKAYAAELLAMQPWP